MAFIPPGHEGIHLAEKIVFAIEDADPGRAAHLVATEGEEIAVEILNVGFHVRDGLRAVEDEQGAIFMGDFREFLRGNDESQDVRDMGNRNDFRVL